MKRESDEKIRPAYQAFSDAKAKVGQAVVVKSLDSDGVLLALADKKGLYKVRVGNLQVAVKADDLAQPIASDTKQTEKEKKQRLVKREVIQSPAEPSSIELKLLGLTVSEAIEQLEPVIISAQSGSIMRIVHGKGTGALGKGIQAYLKTRSEIASYRYGRYGEGDTGVTIAEIK